ncbi:glycosyltransferase [Methanobacterium alcaliphilum]|uniref:glycosyltransferase n=1 Tax=Methanobacterium alcaliphilum TaxID=392018 RepID=UPI00200AE0F0|nr:glycosyltransferase [Methanobacterium alcaliphilum]MCK9151774.1 glycosyltransferase [Methanobacterium alcaliphilum]
MISVIIPMYDEEENVGNTLSQVNSILDNFFDKYEIIVVDDGSSDRTFELVSEIITKSPSIKIIKHSINQGMGKALRSGFKEASGDIIVTLDADLSYDPRDIPLLVKELGDSIDIVVGSQYMPGGETENIPFFRLFLSRMANKIVGYSMNGNLSTVTGIFRAYKKEILDSIEMESNGTEINPEILSKANALGYKIKEVPVKLKGRVLGKSKIKIKATTMTHILFTFYERPMILFGIIGIILCLIGIFSAIYLFIEYLNNTLDPTRPLMLFMVLTILSGIQILIFGFVSTQINLLKREIYIIQKENKLIRKKLK